MNLNLKPHQYRVMIEKINLDERAKKLSNFIGHSPYFKTLSTEEQELQREQNDLMWQYSEVLGKRIAAFSKLEEQTQPL